MPEPDKRDDDQPETGPDTETPAAASAVEPEEQPDTSVAAQASGKAEKAEKAEKKGGKAGADATSKPKQRKQPNKAQRRAQEKKPVRTQPLESPRWWAPTMVALMIIGLVCVVLTYLLRGEAPVPGIGNWNLAIGFAVMLAGFFMTLRWR